MTSIPLPILAGVTHRFVEARGCRFHVAEAGQGEPVVLVHGWPQHWYMWRHQIPALAAHYRVIAIDQRGHGWSDAPAGRYRKEELASDLLAVLDALGLARVRLVGHDWGGWVGFLACLREPARFSHFAALNIAHPFLRWSSNPAGILSLWYQALLGTPLLGPAVVRHPRGFVPRAFYASMRTRPPVAADVAVFAEVLRDPARARATSALYRSFLTRELWQVLAGRYRTQRLHVPTRVLFGVDDVVLSPRLLAGLSDYADEASIELIEQAGHFVAEEQPERVTASLLAFLAGKSGG